MIAAWSDDRAIADDIGNALIIAAIAFAAWQSGERFVQRIGAVVALALVLVWIGSVLVHLPQGQAIVSIAWAIIGTAVFVTGADTDVQGHVAAFHRAECAGVGDQIARDKREEVDGFGPRVVPFGPAGAGGGGVAV